MVAGFMGGFLTRIIGAFFRLVLIMLGLLCSLLSVGFFLVVMILWLFLPVVMPALLYLLGVVSLSML